VAESIKLTQIQQKTSEKKATEPNFNQITNQEEVGENMKSQYSSFKFVKIEGKKEEEKMKWKKSMIGIHKNPN